jgi:hypothetical protein
MNHFELSRDEFRAIILGKITYRKCPCCDSEGLEYWDENGNGTGPCPRPEWGDNYESGLCDNCDGLGFIPNVLTET